MLPRIIMLDAAWLLAPWIGNLQLAENNGDHCQFLQKLSASFLGADSLYLLLIQDN